MDGSFESGLFDSTIEYLSFPSLFSLSFAKDRFPSWLIPTEERLCRFESSSLISDGEILASRESSRIANEQPCRH